MGALLKFTGFVTFCPFTFSRFSSGFSAFRSWKSPTASGSTGHKAAAFLICSIVQSLFFSSCRLVFFRAGGFFGVLGETCEAGNNSCEENEEGLREGRDEVRARPSVLVLSADWDLGGGFGRDGIF